MVASLCDIMVLLDFHQYLKEFKIEFLIFILTKKIPIVNKRCVSITYYTYTTSS